MKKSRFTDTQIVGILNDAEAGMKVSDIKRLKELEDGNTKLKKMFADMALENHALKDLLEKKL